MNRPSLVFLSILMIAAHTTPAPADEVQRLNQLFQREWDWSMQQNPTWASTLVNNIILNRIWTS